MESIRRLPTFSIYVLVLLLRFQAWRERQLKKAIQRAHYVGGERAEWMYPEKKKYLFRILKYRVHLWFSIDKKDTPLV